MSEASYPIRGYRQAGQPKPPIPTEVRAVVLARAGGFCEGCGDRKPLELHHLHYETEGHEHPDDLKALCRSCHLRAHVAPNGQFYADPQELDVEWCTFDEDD